MSSTTTKEASAQSPEASRKPTDKSAISPVQLLDSFPSKTVSLLRPTLLLAILTARFTDLVRDPVSTLQYALPLIVVVQVAYALICLPVAGSQISKKPRPGDSKKRAAGGHAGNTVSTAILALLLTAMVTPIIHVFFILFGAPFLTHVAHTLLCAAHFSLLAMFPIFYTRGGDGHAWVAVVSASAPLDETFGALVGAVLGAWLGAVPIPLDWDREWQKWPVTVLVGLFTGALLGSTLSGRLFHGKRFGVVQGDEE